MKKAVLERWGYELLVTTKRNAEDNMLTYGNSIYIKPTLAEIEQTVPLMREQVKQTEETAGVKFTRIIPFLTIDGEDALFGWTAASTKKEEGLSCQRQ